jgi:hypothetical protein
LKAAQPLHQAVQERSIHRVAEYDRAFLEMGLDVMGEVLCKSAGYVMSKPEGIDAVCGKRVVGHHLEDGPDAVRRFKALVGKYAAVQHSLRCLFAKERVHCMVVSSLKNMTWVNDQQSCRSKQWSTLVREFVFWLGVRSADVNRDRIGWNGLGDEGHIASASSTHHHGSCSLFAGDEIL